MKQTTRDYDLEDLEQYRDDAPDIETKKKRTALLELVYEQAKDPVLESLRVKLMDATKRNDLKAINAIRLKVMEYANQSSFITNLYKKMQQASPERAEVFVANKKK